MNAFTRLSRRALAVIAALAFLIGHAAALEAPEMRGPVNDLAGIMSESERSELESYLTAVNDQTGVQVAVLTVRSLEGDALEDFSMRVAEKWKLGQAGKDNGALLVVSLDDRALRIEVGYGLEESLTDAKSGLIIRSVIAPAFRDGEYGRGIIEGARNMVGIATGNAEIVSQAVLNPKTSEAQSGGGFGGIVIFVIFLILMSLGGMRRRHGGMGGFLGGLLLGNLLSSSGRRGGWSDRSGGGFGGGGFGGGGGFSGGGGGFGGGGASGGW
ncbi:MAG TPA: TPM domain-containing protein [Treponemataceae bacterium]|nr:TPM domain-containing protein [Treponemataceae bacterium]